MKKKLKLQEDPDVSIISGRGHKAAKKKKADSDDDHSEEDDDFDEEEMIKIAAKCINKINEI